MSAIVEDRGLPLLTESESPPAPPPTNPLLGNPGIVGIPTVIVGAVGLGLINIGFLPPTAAGAALPIMIMGNAMGLLITTIWAAALGQNASASLFAVFFAFYGSYAAFVLGIVHGWWGVAPSEVTRATEAWLICWFVTIMMMTLTTLRLPRSFTLLLGLVDLALVLLYEGTATGATAWTRAGGVIVFVFILVAIYLFVDVMSRETGGTGLPLGRPLIGG